MSCPAGTIRRKSYTRKNGVSVKASCVKDVGKPGKGFAGPGKGIGKLKKGQLSSLGYSISKTARSRHAALNKATRKYGPLSIYRKLNALAVYTKNTSPTTSKTAKADRNWIGANHGYKST
jgi:hypothetical protein